MGLLGATLACIGVRYGFDAYFLAAGTSLACSATLPTFMSAGNPFRRPLCGYPRTDVYKRRFNLLGSYAKPLQGYRGGGLWRKICGCPATTLIYPRFCRTMP